MATIVTGNRPDSIDDLRRTAGLPNFAEMCCCGGDPDVEMDSPPLPAVRLLLAFPAPYLLESNTPRSVPFLRTYA
jgi:hypothetical protein